MTVVTSNILFSLAEKDILKAILEFLESRGFHITQLSLEREAGVINGEFSEDVLFLRQLILDGQWDNALDFIEPLKDVPEFDLRTFRYLITKHKYFELLCIKQEPGPLQDNDFAVEEIVECLKDLEHVCPTPEDYRHLCALLTLPKLSDHMDFRYWNPSSARVECFHKVLPLVGDLLPDIAPKKNNQQSELNSLNDRLIQLLTKGIFYEACIDFCQAQALGNKEAVKSGPQFTKLLTNRPKLQSPDLSLVSWLEVVSREQFACPFQQKSLEFKIETLKKPKLEAQWTEQILATPIKPGGQFPHSLMPNSKMKSLQKMTQSLILPAMSASIAIDSSVRTKRHFESQPMSQSTSASIGFSIRGSQQPENEVMQQSQIINNMFENSDLTKTSRPPGAVTPASSSSMSMSVHSVPSSIDAPPQQTITPSPIPPVSMAFDMTNCRRELDNIVRRNQPPFSSSRQSSLPPVPEHSTPGNGPSHLDEPPFDNPMTHSRLFQEFQNRIQYAIPNQMTPSPPPGHLPTGYPGGMPPGSIPHQYMPPPMDGYYPGPYGPVPISRQISPVPPPTRPISTYVPNPYDPMNQIPVRPHSMIGPPLPPMQHSQVPMQYPQQTMGPIPSQAPGLQVQFIPLCKYEDSQAIRAVSFHPSGRHFVIGTNSKQMLLCKYPDIRKINLNQRAIPFNPEILLTRPKQHRGSVYCCGFNPTGELLATGSNDKTIRLMGFHADECKIGAEMELTMHDGTVRELIFMEDSANRSKILVSGGAGNCHICLTDCSTGQTFKGLTGHTAPILGLYSWGGCSFASCSADKSIRFWDIRAANAVNIILPNAKTSNSPVTSLCIDPNGKLLVSGHEDHMCFIYTNPTTEFVEKNTCEDASVMLYDITGGRVVQIFRPHGDEVRTVRFSNAAYYLLSGSYDKRVVITDMRGDLTQPLMYLPVAEHNDKIIQCRWHPHDFTFLSTSADRTAVLWSLPLSHANAL